MMVVVFVVHVPVVVLVMKRIFVVYVFVLD
jgi:hypothetical protein